MGAVNSHQNGAGLHNLKSELEGRDISYPCLFTSSAPVDCGNVTLSKLRPSNHEGKATMMNVFEDDDYVAPVETPS